MVKSHIARRHHRPQHERAGEEELGLALYRSIWANTTNRTIIMATLVSLFTLFAEIYLILWEKRLFEPLQFLPEDKFLEWKLIDFTHVLLWLVTLFFGMIAYATAREMFETPAGWWDLVGAIFIIALLLFLIFNEWLTLLFLVLSSLVIFYFYASIGKS
ncbi:MAG: hypothetical protein ACXAB4_09585 [Candidatus Hodarchaeales archaeon]